LEKEVPKLDNVPTDNNDKVDGIVKNYKLSKSRYLNKGFCNFITKCRYTHPKELCDKYLMCGNCDDQTGRYPELCKFCQSNDCNRNSKWDSLHVTVANEGDEKQMGALYSRSMLFF
jgi:hypothetical protein